MSAILDQSWLQEQAFETKYRYILNLNPKPKTRICRPLRSPGIDSPPGGSFQQPYLTYRPAMLHRLAESIPSLADLSSNPIWRTGLPCYNRLAESIPGLLKHLQIRSLNPVQVQHEWVQILYLKDLEPELLLLGTGVHLPEFLLEWVELLAASGGGSGGGEAEGQ